MTTLVNKTAWSVLASLSSTLGRLVSSVVAARLLGPEGVGQLAYLIWLVEISNVLSSLGLQNSLTRYLAELYGRGKHEHAVGFARWVFQRYLLSSCVAACVLGTLCYQSLQYENPQLYTVILVLMYFLQGMARINAADLAGRQRFDILARINTVSAIFYVCGQCAGIYFYGLPGALAGYTAGGLVPAFLSFSLLRRTCHPRPPRELQRNAWQYAIHTWFAAIVSVFVWSRMEIVFLERYCGAYEVSMFTIGITLSTIAIAGPALLTGALMPHFAQLFGSENHIAITYTYVATTRLVALLLFPLSLGGAAIMPVLLPFLYGDIFIPAVPNAIVLMLLSALGFAGVGSSLIYGLGRSQFIAWGGLLGACLSLIGCILIIPVWGSWGAVLLRAFVQISMIVLGTWYIMQRLQYDFPLRSLGKTLLASSGSAVVAYVALQVRPSFEMIPIAIILGAPTYIGLLKMLRVLNEQDSNHLVVIFSRLPYGLGAKLQPALKWIASSG